jgi:hypothetical protein
MMIKHNPVMLGLICSLLFFSQNISILVVLLYAWRISVNAKKYTDLEDVYYGE